MEEPRRQTEQTVEREQSGEGAEPKDQPAAEPEGTVIRYCGQGPGGQAE